jgi:hypothetical protein
MNRFSAINRAGRERCGCARVSSLHVKRINTMSQFLAHLADDVMPALIEELSEAKT